jgi:hypothetical protein
MNQEVFEKIVEEHQLWLKGSGGRRADFNHADLTGGNLSGLNLSYAQFCHANLSGCSFSETVLTGANMASSRLYCADLTGANLRGTNFSGSNMYGSHLMDAVLIDADFMDANLSEARGIVYAQAAWSGHGECGRQLLAVRINNVDRYFCGCFEGTLKDLDEYIDEGETELKASRRLVRNFVAACMARS